MIEKPTLAADLEKLLNSHSAENASGTPDFILAEFMIHCLKSFNAAVCAREAWHGRDAYGLAALRALKDEALPKLPTDNGRISRLEAFVTEIRVAAVQRGDEMIICRDDWALAFERVGG